MKVIKIIFSLILLIIVAACSDKLPSANNINKDPERIVVMSPAVAEMLAALDLLDRVAGIGQFGPWPETIADRPVVGGYDNPNVERILALGTDIFLNVKSQAAVPAHQRLENTGIEVMELDTSTYSGIFNTLEVIGERFDRKEAARQLARQIRADVDKVKRLARNLPKQRVLFVVGRDPIYVAGPGSHIDHLIRIAGGESIANDIQAPYQQISMEIILERQPEVIIDTSINNEGALRGRQPGSWGKWSFLPAVRTNHVYWIDPSRLVIPGIHLAHMAYLMGKMIHPEVFGEPDPKDYLKLNRNNDVPSG